MSPNEAMRAGARAYYSGNKQEAVQPLQYAADKGEPMATWKLGRMYSQGDGVQEDDIKAFTYFSKIAHVHGEGNPDGPLAPFVANAIVELGTYFLHGINGSSIQPDPARAKELYAYAATYFGDGEAQYRLAMIHLNEDNRNSKRLAARWLKLSANKGHIEAQARFGELLFFNSSSPKRKAQGLNWLTLASQQASGPKQEWIVALHDKAAAHASENENNRAIAWTNTWLSEAGISVMASN
ncbi:tetratricopeptide repeat protein [Pseudovibrio flavus]|uniref:tetratricopeptide repeat protein n=1 Tax=Pseudovibrio flavus TaxID=2529854 RepID=UPI0035288319